MAFNKIDTNKSGDLDKDEITRAFAELSIKINPDFLGKLWSYVDKNNDSVLQFEEYMQMVYIFMNYIPNNLPHLMFLIADKNFNGYVSADELGNLLKFINAGISQQETTKLAIAASGREDGNISYDKFCKMILKILE